MPVSIETYAQLAVADELHESSPDDKLDIIYIMQ